MNKQGQREVNKYMRQLKRTLAGLPRTQRKEILGEIHEHIDESLAHEHPENEQQVRAMLARIGDPYEIANEARRRSGIPTAKFGKREIAALILIPIGGLGYGIPWFLGVILLWTSYAWTTREKLIGTVVPPFGLGFAAVFFPTYFHSTLIVVIGISSLVLAIAVPIWLFVKARKRTRLTSRSSDSAGAMDAAIEGAAGGSTR
jgi:uncharacterized membrane protein